MHQPGDKIRKRDKQNEILLLISNEIVRSRGKQDLLHIIRDTIKKYIHFDDSFILRYNKLNRTCKSFIYYAAKARTSNPVYKNYVDLEYPVLDDSVEDFLYPIVYDIPSLLPYGGEQVTFMHNAGIKEFACIKLIEGNQLIGLFILLSEQKNSFSSNDLDLLQKLSYQLSIATANIIANEEITRREEEKTILLSLSHEIAAVKNKSELSCLLNIKLGELFPVSGFGITLLNADNKTHSPFVVDAQAELRNNSDFIEAIKLSYSVEDGVFNNIINEEEPVTLQVSELSEMEGAPAYVHLWKKMGISHVVGMPVKAGENKMGCFILLHDQQSGISFSNNLVKGVCAQISVAISNIIAIEEIVKREEEKTLLLSLCHKIAALRNRNDLLQVVNTKLKKIFQISEFGIAQINDDGQTYSAFVLDLGDQIKSHADFEAITSDKYSVLDFVFAKIMRSDDFVLFKVDDLLKEPGIPAYVNFWKKAGLQRVLCVPLRAGGNDIGCAFLHIDNDSDITNKNNLITGICAQLSVAVSNILANEEIIRREQERELLLSLNTDIAGVRNNEELLSVINHRLKNLLRFTHTLIAVINADDTSTISTFLHDPESKSKNHAIYPDARTRRYNINDGILNKTIISTTPVVFDLAQLDDAQQLPAYLQVNFESGINRIVTTRFSNGNKVFGCWILFFENGTELGSYKSSLIKSVSDQVSIALSNIISNDEIKGREEEKSKLLEFSNALASVRNRVVLAKILKQKLMDLFDIEEYIINGLTNDKKTYYPLLYDTHAGFAQLPEFQKANHLKNVVEDGVINRILDSPNPLTFNVDEWFKLPNVPSYANVMREIGIKKVIGIRIQVGEENIAFLTFTQSDKNEFAIQESLFKSVCSQIAITVSTIIANDEITKKEKEKALLLGISNDMATIRNKNDLRQIMDEKLKTILSVNNISYCYLSPDGLFFGSFILDPTSPSVKHPKYAAITAAMHPVNDGIVDKILASETPLVFDTEAYVKTTKIVPAYFMMIHEVGMQQIIFARLKNGENTLGFLAITRKIKAEIDEEQLNLIKGIASQLSVALHNIKANEQIENQVEEIKKYKDELKEENLYLHQELNSGFNNNDTIGDSLEMKKVFRMVQQVASSDSTVLILGETGTGKELIARAIHNASPRKNKLMVKVNCAALPANLIESELFGHERGSFTGATERRIGKFELANNGTLLLDEIGEMPLELQVKLLRALQEKEIERVGGRTTIKVDVRIIAATNRDLEKLMEEGRFRSDLFYRLNIFPIYLPPLRDRSEDIPSLALHFLQRFSKKSGKQINTFSNKALKELLAYKWPGNIRELEHLIERSVLLAAGDTLKEIHLPSSKTVEINVPKIEDLTIKTIDENERDYILKVLKKVNGRISGEGGAAELLGIPPSTLNSRMKRLGIRRAHSV